MQDLYSAVPIQDLPSFLGSLIPGVIASDKLLAEKYGGLGTSNCATVLIPLNENDCICHFVVDRETAMASIMRYELTSLVMA